jgi:hypothetical protein
VCVAKKGESTRFDCESTNPNANSNGLLTYLTIRELLSPEMKLGGEKGGPCTKCGSRDVCTREGGRELPKNRSILRLVRGHVGHQAKLGLTLTL